MEKELIADGIIAYCDGGAAPNPGACGSGIHGYAFVYPTDKDKPTKVGTKHIATDKGYVVQKDLTEDHIPVKITGYFEIAAAHGIGTNNLGEIRAVSILLSMPICDRVNNLRIICDSKLVVQGATEWVPNWIRNNWIKSDGRPVSNKEEWEALSIALERFKLHGTFNADWVYGHNDDYGNTIADQLASLAVNMSRTGYTGISAKEYTPEEYKKISLELHPFICLNRVYFNTQTEFNQKGLYYQTDGTDDKFIFGKRTSESVFSVIKLRESDRMLDLLVEAACSRPDMTNAIAYIRLDRLRKADIQKMASEYGQYCFQPASRNMNVDFLDKRPVVFEVKPGELQLRAVEVLGHLEEILNEYETLAIQNNGFVNGAKAYQVHDITDHFYDTRLKKVKQAEVEIKELKKEFGNGAKKTKLTLPMVFDKTERKTLVNLLLGVDLPSRNTLKQIEGDDPEIVIVAWPNGDKALQYAVVVKTEGAVGIWSNYFANLLLSL